jgi:hypothetical protein
MTTTFRSRLDRQGTYWRLEYSDGVFALAQGLSSAPDHIDGNESLIFLGGDAITWLLANAALLESIIPRGDAPADAEPEISITIHDLGPKLDEHGQPILDEVDAALHVVWPAEFARDRRVTAADGYGPNHDCRFRLSEPLDLPAGWQGTIELDITVPEAEDPIGGVPVAAHTVTWSLGVVVIEEKDGILVVHLTRPPELREGPTQEVAS